MGTVDFVSPFCVCGAGTCGIAFEDDCTMKYISSEWQVEMIMRVIGKA